MNKSFVFRLKPTKEQETLIQKTFGCVRFIYNKMLSDRITTYDKYKDRPDVLKSLKGITPAKYKQEFVWLKEIDSLSLANAQMNLQSAFSNFFRDKNIGFPKFKSKKNARKSYTTNNLSNSIRIENSKIKLPKLGFVKIIEHRSIPSDHTIKSVTVSQTPAGHYQVSILTEFDFTPPTVKPSIDKVIGLDFDMKHLYTDSQGNKALYPRFYQKALEKLKVSQRRLSHMRKYSNNYFKQKKVIAKLHERISNCRKDFLHKLANALVDKFDVIGIEDLNMQTMSKSLHFGKSVHDNSWGKFVEFLKYKLPVKGKFLVKVSKWFPSSKTCNSCGYVHKNLKLSDRLFYCDNCGVLIERDPNAARNIRDETIRLLFGEINNRTVGTTGLAC